MSGRIPRTFIDNLLARTDIVQTIHERVPLKKQGREYVACCPFHHEKTPSFTVSPQKQFYHCFGCGAHGNAIDFMMAYEHLEFIEAIEALAGESGMEVIRETSGMTHTNQAQFEPLYACLNAATQFFQQQLKTTPAAIEYLKQRGVHGETARDFALGYAPAAWEALKQALEPRFGLDTLLQAGLLSTNDRGRHYDKFRDRLMFPIKDRRGRTIAFGGRIVSEGEPKYLNSPVTPLFDKSNTLYGLFEARRSRQRLDRLIVVEGYMDVVALAQYGLHHAVATLGTATTTEHVHLLFRNSHKVVFCFDGDRAGKEAAWRALTHCIPALRDDLEARFLFLPNGEDPDSYIHAHGLDAFNALTEQAQPFSQYLLEELKSRHSIVTLEGRSQFMLEARKLLKPLNAPLLRQQLEATLNRLTGIETHHKSHQAPTPIAPRIPPLQMTPMRVLIAALLQNPDLLNLVKSDNAPTLSGIPGAEVLEKITTEIEQAPMLSPAMLMERFRDDPMEPHLRRLFQWRPPNNDGSVWESLLKDALGNLRKQQRTLRVDHLLTKAQNASLSPEEREELRTLFSK